MFYEQLENLCNKNGEKVTPLVQKLGFSRGNIAKWKAGATPNGDIIKAFADYFKVSADYLLETEYNLNNKEYSEDQIKILDYYSRLNNEEKDYIKGKMVEFIMEKGKKDTEFAEEWAQ